MFLKQQSDRRTVASQLHYIVHTIGDYCMSKMVCNSQWLHIISTTSHGQMEWKSILGRCNVYYSNRIGTTKNIILLAESLMLNTSYVWAAATISVLSCAAQHTSYMVHRTLRFECHPKQKSSKQMLHTYIALFPWALKTFLLRIKRAVNLYATSYALIEINSLNL